MNFLKKLHKRYKDQERPAKSVKKSLRHAFIALIIAFAGISGVDAPAKIQKELTRSATFPAEEKEVKLFEDASENLDLQKRKDNLARFISDQYKTCTVAQAKLIVDEAYKAGKKYNLDPLLLLAVMGTESSFNVKAHNKSGAQGLMQVMVKVHTEKFAPHGGTSQAKEIKANIDVGAKILAEYMKKSETIYSAFKRYKGAKNLEHDKGYGNRIMNLRTSMAEAAAGRFQVAAANLKKAYTEVAYYYEGRAAPTLIKAG